MPLINRSSTVFKLISFSIIILLAIIIGKIFVDNWNKIPFDEIKLNYGYLICSILFCLITATFPAWLWKNIFHLLDEKPRFIDLWRINTYSQIARYLPGKIWHYMGKIYWGQKLGLSRKKIVVSTFFETILSICSAFLVSLYSLHVFLPKGSIYIVCIGIIAMLVSLHPRLLEKTINFIGKKWLSQPIVINFRYRNILLLLLLYVILSLLVSFQFFIFLLSFYQISFSHYIYFASINAASWLVGFLSFIAPSGLVVKEGVFVFGFKLIVPVSLAIMCAILMRIYIIVTEVLFSAIFFAFDKSAWQNLIELRKSSPESGMENNDEKTE